MDIAVLLPGGGSCGAFQIGVLDALVHQDGLDVGLFAGISTGSIQALGAAQDRIPDLRKLWESIRSEQDVYRKRRLGLAGALALGRSSLFENSPLRRKIREFHDQEALRRSGKGLMVGAVRLQDGELLYFNEDDADIAEWVIASDASPGPDQPVSHRNDGQWVAGSARELSPIGAVLKRRPKAILVIAAKNLNREVRRHKQPFYDSLSIAMRAAEILSREVLERDINRARRINGLVRAAKAQERALKELEISDVDRQRVLRSINEQIAGYRDVPIAVIEADPAYILPHSARFQPDEIRRLIAHGEVVARRAETQALIADLKRRAGIG